MLSRIHKLQNLSPTRLFKHLSTRVSANRLIFSTRIRPKYFSTMNVRVKDEKPSSSSSSSRHPLASEHPNPNPILMWFRSDLRVFDNPALYNAVQYSIEQGASAPIVGLFIISPEEWKQHDLAPIRVQFMMQSLVELKKVCQRCESCTVLCRPLFVIILLYRK